MDWPEELLRLMEARWEGVEVLYAEPWTEPWSLRPGLRDDYEIYVVEKGRGVVTLGDQSLPVEEGDVIALYSMDGNAFTPEGPFRMALVTFSLPGTPETDPALGRLVDSLRADGVIRGLPDVDGLLDTIYRMNRQMLMRAPGYRFRLRALLAELLLQLAEARAAGVRSRPMDTASRRSVDEIARYLYEHADGPVTLRDIAQEVNLNEHYICTLYRRHTGKSIMAHLHEIRIGRARRLLTHTPLSVTQIAHETGFSSSQYFARVFKRMVGMTPGQYRTGGTDGCEDCTHKK